MGRAVKRVNQGEKFHREIAVCESWCQAVRTANRWWVAASSGDSAPGTSCKWNVGSYHSILFCRFILGCGVCGCRIQQSLLYSNFRQEFCKSHKDHFFLSCHLRIFIKIFLVLTCTPV